MKQANTGLLERIVGQPWRRILGHAAERCLRRAIRRRTQHKIGSGKFPTPYSLTMLL